ncbi:MAG: autotransporter outer membrane beta-barrel domain-containing protein, partial [Opitutaceae bacterium]|nr:autotransporter outer membrane beta-barrel domain-containing protein [Opitutaceae bacterium]
AGFIEINAITPDRTFAIGHLSGSGDTYIGNNTLVIGGLDDRPMTISGGIFYGDHNGNGSAGVLGGIEKTGDSTLTLSGANTYYGPTAVTAGRLVLAAPDTIAHSALITLSGAATLAVTADNTLQNLTSASDAATLELAAATTTTLRNARVEIPDTDNASAPVIISTGNTAYDGRITGPGALRKTGDGALTLNGVSTYSGPTTIAAGVLQIGDATHPAASITSDITIAAGATLAGYGRITGSITNNGIISLGDAFEPAATPAPTPTPIPYIALRAAAPGNPAAAPAPATGNYTIQGSLTNNNLLKLGRSGGTPGNTLTITGAYAGNGVIRLNTNLATGNTDHLIVRGNATGAVNLMIDTTSAASSNIRDDARLALVALPAATTAAITLVDTSWNPIDYIEAGMHTFQLTVVDGGVQLLSYDRQSHAADAILATASVAGAEWHYALDNLSKRLGDLRAETAGARTPESGAPGATRGSVWLRANTYRLNADTGISRASFHEYVSSINGGIDILRPTPRGALYLGGYFDIGHAGRTFDNHGDGSTSALGLGLYATLINPDGWYLDLIAKLERNKNEFNARATDGHITSGIYTTKNEILSVEFGRRLANAGGWWVEPGAQIAVAWLGGDSYTTTGATQIPVRISNAMAMQYRVQLRAGKHIDSSRWNPYVKFAAAKNDSDTASVTAWDKTYARDCDGWRAETGAGASYLIDASSQLYFDYEYAKAASYERPWSLTLGYRRVW